MKSASERQAGYTIVEVMIFLIISSVLVLSVVGLFNGRIQRTQFSQAVQALDVRIKTTANEVATGTYLETPSFTCDASSGAPVIRTGSDQQGTRADCVFAGKIIAPAASCSPVLADGGCTKIDFYTVVGRRSISASNQVPDGLTGPNGAKPRLVPAITQTADLDYSTQITGIYQKSTPPELDSGLGFFQSFNGSYNSNGELASGAHNIQSWFVRSVVNPPSPISADEMAQAVSDEKLTQPTAGTTMVCLRSADNRQKASITIGNTNGSIATNVVMGDEQCP